MAGLVPATQVFAKRSIERERRRGWPGQAHGCPVHFLLYIAHGIDSTGSGIVGERSGHERGVNAMRHHNSVFHQLMKHLPWDDFDRLARAHRADARARRLTSKSQFLAMLYGQLAGAASLREIVSGIESHAARLHHLGAQLPRRSTLADANHDRPSALFTELLALLMARAHRGLRRRLAETTYLIDATGLRLDAPTRARG